VVRENRRKILAREGGGHRMVAKWGKFVRNLAMMNELCSVPTKITQQQINIPIVAAVSPGGGPHNLNVSVPFQALFQITACQIVSPRQLNLHTTVPLSATQEPAWGQELLVRVLFLC